MYANLQVLVGPEGAMHYDSRGTVPLYHSMKHNRKGIVAEVPEGEQNSAVRSYLRAECLHAVQCAYFA